MRPSGAAPPLSPAGRGRGAVGSDSVRELRRPHHAMDEVVRGVASLDPFSAASAVPQPSSDGWSSGRDSFGAAAASAQTSLNVQASEFVPKSMLNVGAKEFVPRSMAPNTSQWGYAQAQSMSSGQVDPVAEVRSSVGSLVYSPGRFELVAQQMVDILANYVTDVATLNLVLDVILDTCLRETNFRYTGARLLDYLSASLLDTPFETKTFRSVLLDKCQALNKATQASAASRPWRLRSFALFMADLSLQLGVYSPDGYTKTRVPVLCTAVLDILNAMLTETVKEDTQVKQDEAKENFKAIAQTLKLAGAVLETEERGCNASNSTPKTDELMSRLTSATKDPSVTSWLPAHIVQMLASLVELREANWGQQAAPAGGGAEYTGANATHQQQYNNIPHQESSNELTAEEMQFLNEQMGFVESSSEEDFDGPEEMSDEIEAAYEQFVAGLGK